MKDGIKTNLFGNQYWINEKGYLHRLNNKPAFLGKNGNKEYFFKGEMHRVNGPANTWNNGNKEYFFNDIKLKKPDKYTLWICNKVEST